MSLRLEEVNSLEDFVDVGACMSEGFAVPYNSYWEICKGPSVEEGTKRYWGWHESTPGSRWIKVVDSQTGEVLGGAEWIVHKQNPFEMPQPIPEATWWPEGPTQDIANQFTHQFLSERPHRMSRPHVLLSILFTSPNARRRGVGRMMMAYGIQIADELELDMFVEASPMGIYLYLASGFLSVGQITVAAHNDNPTPEWTLEAKRISPTPFQVEIMWRPKGGKAELAKRPYPWESETSVRTASDSL